MPKRSSIKKKPDLNELANEVIDQATSEKEEQPQEEPEPADEGENPAAVALGRLGGLRGGKARAKKLTKRQRSEAARKAALARWKNKLTRKDHCTLHPNQQNIKSRMLHSESVCLC